MVKNTTVRSAPMQIGGKRMRRIGGGLPTAIAVQKTAAHTAFFTYCGPCFAMLPHCTRCGVTGRDHLSPHYGEPSHWERKLSQSLWRCGFDGCTHLLCSQCGSSHDGCQIHERFHVGSSKSTFAVLQRPTIECPVDGSWRVLFSC